MDSITIWRHSVTIALMALAVSAGFLAPRSFRAAARWNGRALRWFGLRPRLTVVVITLLAGGVSAIGAAFAGFHWPRVHDEFSHILGAQTFALGRLTNPTHPMWRHFETFHVLFQPYYISKYPPAQALFMAAGLLLTGHAAVGVWISFALACGAVCWMLMAWMPPRWAALGGLLIALHRRLNWWGQNYWGGAVSMAGGALVVGALGRMLKRPTPSNAVIMGVGMILMANDRPYEGALLSVTVGVILIGWMLRKNGPAWKTSFRKIILPLAAVLLCGAGAMAYYNWRTTGNAALMPYTLYESQYASAPPFLFQPLTPRQYRHPVMQAFYERDVTLHEIRRLWWVFAHESAHRIAQVFWVLNNSWPSALLLLPLPWMLKRERRMRMIAGICLISLIGAMPVTWWMEHYMAPLAGVFMILPMQGMRYLRQWRWRKREMGRAIAAAVCFSWIVAAVIGMPLKFRQETDAWYGQRIALQEQLERRPGKQLVLVRYGPDHDTDREWVFNEPRIDQSKVIWAREMGLEEDRELLTYFPDRQVWLIDADAKTPALQPYSPSIAQSAARH